MRHARSFPPPVDRDEFIVAPTRPRTSASRSACCSSVVARPGSPARSAFAQLVADDAELQEPLGEVPIAVVDKGATPGAHQLSGAVVVPDALQELFPDTTLDRRSVATSGR